MDKPHPYITAALLCDKVLEEKNGTLSAMRIADRMEYRLEGVPEGLKPMISICGLVCLKSGPVVGDHTLKVIVEKPGGDRKEAYSLPLKLMGKDHGQNVIMNIALGIEQEGLYWFDVLFDEDLLTRIPLMVVQQQAQVPQEKKT